jgi:chorismate mutase
MKRPGGTLAGMPLRALRGATTLDADEIEHLSDRMIELLQELFDRNGIDHDDLVSIIFTATDDIRCTFPATAARKFGLGDVPLICAQELDVEGGTPLCVRVLIHLETQRERGELHHVYQHGARGLRDDLPA